MFNYVHIVLCVWHRPCAWSWCTENPSAETEYLKLIRNIKDIAKKHCRVDSENMIFCYNKRTLHCTIATLISFKDAVSPLCEAFVCKPGYEMDWKIRRQRIFDIWSELLSEYFEKCSMAWKLKDNVKCTVGYEVELSSIEISRNACIFHFTDEHGVISTIRDCIRDALQDIRLSNLEIELGLEPNSLSKLVHIPNILHSTFVR